MRLRPLSSLTLALTALGLRAQAPPDQSAFFILAEQSRTAFTIQGTGARAVGTGGAFIAVADDATAVSFNPAGLAQLLRPEFSLVGQNLTRDQGFQNFITKYALSPDTYDDSSAADRRTTPTFFSTAVPFKQNGRNWVVQLSYQRIIDLDFDSDRSYRTRPTGTATSPRRVSQSIQQDGGIGLWSLGLGMELTPRFSAGVSLNYWRGDWGFFSQGTSINEITGNEFQITFRQKNQFRGWNYNLGLLWHSKYLNMGLVYRAPFVAEYTFQNDQTVDPETGPPVDRPSVHYSTQMKWPESMGGGLSFHPTGRLTFMADYMRTRWSRAVLKSDDPAIDGANFFDLRQQSFTKDTLDTRAGVELIAWLGDSVVIPIRLGVFSEPQPIVDSRTKEQRIFKGYTSGFGIKFKDVTLDIAYKLSHAERQVTRFLDIRDTLNPNSAAYGTEVTDEKRIYLSAIFQMNTAKVHRVLRWVGVGD